MKSSCFDGPPGGIYLSRFSTSLDLQLIEMRVTKGRMKCADLAGFGCVALLSVKDANGTYVRISQFCQYSMPTDDVPMGVRHGCKMEALSDKGAIAIRPLG